MAEDTFTSVKRSHELMNAPRQHFDGRLSKEASLLTEWAHLHFRGDGRACRACAPILANAREFPGREAREWRCAATCWA